MSSPVSRSVFIDHLRIVLTALVILHHVAIVYGGSGGWYWREEPNASSRLLLFFNTVNQSYFMGFFFLLAGYYTPAPYVRKGAWQFLGDRMLRLGVPLLCYFFILSPLTIALARTGGGQPFGAAWRQMIREREFEPGPLWFAEALLIFAVAYIAWRKAKSSSASSAAPAQFPGIARLATAAFVVGAISFVIRLWVPVGKNVLWLQLGYFAPYILLFYLGCVAARERLLERVTFAEAKPWLLVSLITFLLLPLIVVFHGDKGSFEGGWTFNAAFYAWWDPFLSCGIILGLLWACRAYWDRETSVTTGLARSAYAAYIVHPPVIVGLSLLAHGWSAPPLLKFSVIGLASCFGAFAIGALLRMLPGARRIV